MKTNKSNLSNLSKDIVNAIQLFAEFGERGHYVRKGRVIIVNDVYEPEAEGVFLARCARKIAKRMGNAYAYEWAMSAFTNGAYNRLKAKNNIYSTMAQIKAQTRRIELGIA